MKLRILISCLLCIIGYAPAFSQQSPVPSSPGPDFASLTKSRLQAATAGTRDDWEKTVASIAVVIDQSGGRKDRDQFWQDEVRSCRDAHCEPESFNIKSQPGIAVVEYSLVVASPDTKTLIRSTDTYTLSDSSWKVISGFRTVVPNARKLRFSVDTRTLQLYVGKYSDKSGQIYEVSLDGDRLSVRLSGQTASTELIPQSTTKFCVIGDESVTEFTKSKHGEVTGIVIRTMTGEQNLTRVQ